MTNDSSQTGTTGKFSTAGYNVGGVVTEDVVFVDWENVDQYAMFGETPDLIVGITKLGQSVELGKLYDVSAEGPVVVRFTAGIHNPTYCAHEGTLELKALIRGNSPRILKLNAN